MLAVLRRRKDPDELLRILHSYELCWLGQLQIARVAAEGGSEIEAYSAAEAVAQIAHGSPIEFNSDLLSGPYAGLASSPSHIPGTRAIQRDDPVLADVALRADGYWGDTAETHLLGQEGEIAEARAELVGVLAQAGSELKPGLSAAELYASVRRRILAHFPDGDFPHHAGHGLGLEFEPPFLVPWDMTELETLDGDRAGTRRLLPGPVGCSRRESVPRHSQRRSRVARSDGSARLMLDDAAVPDDAAPLGGDLQVSAARCDITPMAGVRLVGYLDRDLPADSVNDPLTATAVALRDPVGDALVIVCCDVLGFPLELSRRIRREHRRILRPAGAVGLAGPESHALRSANAPGAVWNAGRAGLARAVAAAARRGRE